MRADRSMSIRFKTTLFVASTLGALIGLIAAISFMTSLSRIGGIESDRANDEVELVNRQLGNSLEDLGGTNADWAWWDDSYDFMSGTNLDYVESNLYAEAFSPIGIDVVAYVTVDGEVVHQAWFADETEKPVPEPVLDTGRPGGLFADFASDSRATPGGIVQTDEATFLVTARAILPPDFNVPPAGVLIMARIIDDDFVTELAALTGLDVELSPCSRERCDTAAGATSLTKTSQQITATSTLGAADGTPALRLDITGPRSIYRQSISGIRWVLLTVIAVGVLAVLLTLSGLQRLVVGPLEQLGSTVAEVGRTNDPSLRATVDRHDEIGDLAADMNVMLTRLERSQNDLLAAKSEIEGASAAKSKFLSRVSHEVRTPLNGVLAYAQLLQLEDLGSDAEDSVGQIVSAARHITQLVDEFLDIARIEAGAIPLTLDTIDATAVAQEAISLTQPVAAEHGCRVELQSKAPISTIADDLRLRQILLNLVSNAIKYGGTRKPVEVVTMHRADRCFIIVRDGGDGIPADQLHRLFVPFDRLDADSGTKSGTGIGLSVTKQLVELMHGSIEVVSEAGVGTAFIVSLPTPDAAKHSEETFPADEATSLVRLGVAD